MSTPLIDDTEFKIYLRSELSAVTEIAERVAAVTAATSWLEQQCQRQWAIASGSTTRVFDAPDCSPWLTIPDATTVTQVIDFTTTLTVDVGYKLYPLNGIGPTGETLPYSKIARLTSGYFYNWYNYAKPGTISVTATWGWAAIPSMIIEACKIVAKDYVLNRDVAHGVIEISSVGGVGSRENRLVTAAIEKYGHPASIGIA